MQFRELSVPGSWEITPRLFGDPRGVFLEAFKEGPFVEAVGHPLDLKQANSSVSAAGVVRGIHYADVPPSQAKYVMCPRGAVLDVVVDIRVGSPTFGRWDSVLLDDVDRRAIYISEGLGHAFCSLEDGSTVVYLCSAPYAPGREHGVNPTCETVGIEWPTTGRDGRPLELLLSEKDTAAPGLRQAQEQGLLPRYAEVQDFLATLR
ncbi:dTDP-4-dehydrorhamnose 3,5-epimerase [Georgenia sp. TF02-10]|uniref:dTDP-4-dehydrorhamnose 3,5-epimerase family protein n=1 Tax=Georgenia sp. TF02-10 TaxID=2917725 RepID=UPI001FA763D8|nr:dTDP-4-dehydrorhamnose 3,5-epimerase [Georgenia sp. TF02-10]UNX55759.1 dTDP-4-dehydrorhamnose 3,5-epimerase [Georgenia sp. TF02-10]